MASSLSEELLAIRVEMQGARKAAEESRDLAAAQKGIGTSTEKVGTAADKTSKKTGRLAKVYGALGKAARWGVGFLGVGAVFALHSAIEKTEDLAKTTIGLTRNLDLSSKVSSRWGAVMQARDIDSKALTMSFGILSSKMVEAARKGGTALTPFHQLGLTQEDAAKGADNFQWGLMRVAKALGDAEGGAQRLTAAKALLGKGFQALLPLFSSGTKGLKEELHWADEFGVTLSGTTTDGLMDMVQAQRKSKVAILGLQIAVTKALMPAIEGGEDQLQQFIATLNDDKLSGDQKVARIEKQFEDLENRLIQIIADALPKVAEQGGVIGLKLAGAIWTGFKNSNLLGKAVIALWLFKVFGGGAYLSGLLKTRYGKVGTTSGKAFMGGVLLGTVGLGFLLAEELDRKNGFRSAGISAAEDFINGVIHGLNELTTGGSGLFGGMNPVLEAVGIDGDSPIPEVNFRNEGPGPTAHGPVHKSLESIPPGPGLKTSPGRGGRPRANKIAFKSLGLGGGSSRPIIVQSILDGKVVAESVTHHAENAAALR